MVTRRRGQQPQRHVKAPTQPSMQREVRATRRRCDARHLTARINEESGRTKYTPNAAARPPPPYYIRDLRDRRHVKAARLEVIVATHDRGYTWHGIPGIMSAVAHATELPRNFQRTPREVLQATLPELIPHNRREDSWRQHLHQERARIASNPLGN